MTFVGDGEYPLAMQRVCRLLESYVLEERVDGSQARIPCAGAILTNPFQVFEEQTQGRVRRDLRSGFSTVLCQAVLLQNAEADGSSRDIPLWCAGLLAVGEVGDQ
jgi:hypothetical protein